MAQRFFVRYSLAFQCKVVGEVKSGEFATPSAAGRHYGVGPDTVLAWMRKPGKNHLLTKVVPVETMDEKDRLLELKKRVAQLEAALGQMRGSKRAATKMSRQRIELYNHHRPHNALGNRTPSSVHCAA